MNRTVLCHHFDSSPNQDASFSNRCGCLFDRYRRSGYHGKLHRRAYNLHQQKISRYEVFTLRQLGCLWFYYRCLYEELEFSTAQCKMITFLTRALYCSTAFHLIALSYERYLAIVKSPLTYNQHITNAKTLLLVGFAWILPFATAPGLSFGVDHSSFNARLYHCDVCHGWDVQSRDQLTRSIVYSVATFAVPLLIIAWLNFRVFSGERNHNSVAFHPASTKQTAATQGRQRCRRCAWSAFAVLSSSLDGYTLQASSSS